VQQFRGDCYVHCCPSTRLIVVQEFTGCVKTIETNLQCILLMRMSKMWPSSRIINNSQHYTLQACTYKYSVTPLTLLSATRVGVARSCCHQNNRILFHLLLLQHCLYWQLLALLLGSLSGHTAWRCSSHWNSETYPLSVTSYSKCSAAKCCIGIRKSLCSIIVAQ